MKIADLQQHCGDCGVMDYCGEAFCYCLCSDPRFSDIDEVDFERVANSEPFPNFTQYEECVGCTRPDCDVFRYSKELYADEPCEHRDLSRDHFCHQMADYVHKKLTEEGDHGGEQ